MTAKQLLLLQKIPQTYRDNALKVIQEIAIFLKIQWLWLLLVMFKESRLNPEAVNPKTGAKGILQFMPSTLKDLEAKLGKKLPGNFLGQLEFVKAYFKPYVGKLSSFEDVYFAVFYPAAIGKPDDFILGITRSDAYARLLAKQNKALDKDGDGLVTVGEAKTWFKVGVLDYLEIVVTKSTSLLFVVGIIAAFFFS